MRAEQAGVSGGWGWSLNAPRDDVLAIYHRLEHLVLPPGTAERRGWNGLPGGRKMRG